VISKGEGHEWSLDPAAAGRPPPATVAFTIRRRAAVWFSARRLGSYLLAIVAETRLRIRVAGPQTLLRNSDGAHAERGGVRLEQTLETFAEQDLVLGDHDAHGSSTVILSRRQGRCRA
jgi:hypothetical protein